MLKEVPATPNQALQLTELNSFAEYRICIYNAYFWEQENVEQSCRQFETVQSGDRAHPIAGPVEQTGGNVETLIGLLTGALVVILTLIIVAVLFWKSNRFSNDKIPDEYPRTSGNHYFLFFSLLCHS